MAACPDSTPSGHGEVEIIAARHGSGTSSFPSLKTEGNGAATTPVVIFVLLSLPSGHVLKHSRHAGFQVIQIMAVEEPPARIVCGEFDAHRLVWRDAHRVLKRRAFLRALQDAEEVTMQMHR